ncbi:hypothetical protein KGQ74_02020 [Patescibacteria group bacterium]|nr:hypothetical protein [Patescibacteria group bacterium]
MQTIIRTPSKTIAVDIPYSRMKYPDVFWQKAFYFFWRICTPIHPFLRDLLLRLRIIRHVGRQEYPLGRIDIDASLEPMIRDLVARGYGNHFVAWKDSDELVSLRCTPDFEHQYHIRIFADGEVRAHYEYTPECHPIRHMREVGIEERRGEFLSLVKKYLIA